MPLDRDAVNTRWTSAVEAYRRSVDLYRQVVEIRERARRRSNGQDAGTLHVVSDRVLRGEVMEDPPARPSIKLEPLTAREREVAMLIACGYTNQQIAEALIVTRGTVANHVAHILSKLNLSNRTQVAAYVTRADHTVNGVTTEPG